MNVDLQWCPCGKQARENDMYCSDICHFLEQYPAVVTNKNISFNESTTPTSTTSITSSTCSCSGNGIKSRISIRKPINTNPFSVDTNSRLTYRSRQRINNQYNTFRAINALSTRDYFSAKSGKAEYKDQRKMKFNSKNTTNLSEGLLKRNMVSHSNFYSRIVNESQDKPLVNEY